MPCAFCCLQPSPLPCRGGAFHLLGLVRGNLHFAQGHLATKREGRIWTYACLVWALSLSTRPPLPGKPSARGWWPHGKRNSWLGWLLLLLKRCVSSECMLADTPSPASQRRRKYYGHVSMEIELELSDEWKEDRWVGDGCAWTWRQALGDLAFLYLRWGSKKLRPKSGVHRFFRNIIFFLWAHNLAVTSDFLVVLTW